MCGACPQRPHCWHPWKDATQVPAATHPEHVQRVRWVHHVARDGADSVRGEGLVDVCAAFVLRPGEAWVWRAGATLLRRWAVRAKIEGVVLAVALSATILLRS